MTEQRFFEVLGMATWAHSARQKARYLTETTREERKIVNYWLGARAAYDAAKEEQKMSEQCAKINAFDEQKIHGARATAAWHKGNENWRKFKAAIQQ